ncbi:uncharacterized protein LOC116161106 [Photinus pyralis]|uniref:uncharacterized protein LOC116161106 n=1 Tax=Photinus pyralis TaxID=7054 RepID=UPI001266E9FB|nr:uncharacterized protein LOC116161106 [Photinus pyralis]
MEAKLDLVLSKLDLLENKSDTAIRNIAILSATIENLKTENSNLRTQMQQMEKKIDYLENQSRRNNVIFYNVKEDAKEDTEAKVRQIIDSQYKISLGDKDIERAHRLATNVRTSRPIIIKFNNFKVKDFIVRNAFKLKNTPVSVSEDFSKHILQKRSLLKPYLMQAKSEGKRAHLKFDMLYINGRKYTVDDLPANQVLQATDFSPEVTHNDIITRSKSGTKPLTSSQ